MLRDATDLSGGVPGVKGRPLYYLMQHVLLYVLPPTALLLRLPALFFGIVGVWLTARLASELFGRPAAVVAAAMVAISSWHVHASQFARYWTLVYLASVLTIWLLVRAVDRDRPRPYLLALLALLLGTATHPTFLFPLPGVVLGLYLIRREGTSQLPWPTRRAWKFLWGPFALFLISALVALKATGNDGALQNWGGRGMDATLRLVPAIVQWLGPELVAAALVGVAYLYASRHAGDRRWACMAGLGAGVTLAALLTSSLKTDVYADYAMGMLPLVFVTVGGAAQRIGDRLPVRPAAYTVAAVFLIAAGMLPSTVSHMLDGTRFDYRPAFAHIQQEGPSHLVLGWPAALQARYAPELRFEELRMTTEQLNDAARQSDGFWLITSHQRYGLVLGNDQVESWIRGNCRTVSETQRMRLDYRQYRVVLHWCGNSSVPSRRTALGG